MVAKVLFSAHAGKHFNGLSAGRPQTDVQAFPPEGLYCPQKLRVGEPSAGAELLFRQLLQAKTLAWPLRHLLSKSRPSDATPLPRPNARKVAQKYSRFCLSPEEKWLPYVLFFPRPPVFPSSSEIT